MSSRIVKLLTFFALVALLSYIYVLNPESVNVHLSRSQIWSAPLALVLITIFSTGVAFTAAIAFFVGAQHTYRHWRERRKFQLERDHFDRIVRVREQIASENYDRASAALKRMIDEDNTNIVARLMYAQTLYAMHHLNEAIMVLDEARASFGSNLELPLLAAQIHIERSNYTAALDNLQLVLQSDPENLLALRHARFCSRKLANFDSTLHYSDRLVRLTTPEEGKKIREELAEVLISRAKSENSDLNNLLVALDKIRGNFRESDVVLAELGATEKKLGHPENAVKQYARAYSLHPHVEYLAQMASCWLESHDPSKAIASVRGAVMSQSSLSKESVRGRLFFIRLLLHLEEIDGARAEFQKLKTELSQSALENTGEIKHALTLIEARLLERTDKIEPALDLLLASLIEREGGEGSWLFRNNDQSVASARPGRLTDQPPPRLSTP